MAKEKSRQRQRPAAAFPTATPAFGAARTCGRSPWPPPFRAAVGTSFKSIAKELRKMTSSGKGGDGVTNRRCRFSPPQAEKGVEVAKAVVVGC